MFQKKSSRENQNTHVTCNIFFPPKIVPFLYNVEKYSRGGEAADDNIVWRMRIACSITRAKNTYSE